MGLLTMSAFDPRLLKPGDHLLYRPSSFFGHLIALKTWCRVASHVEVYSGAAGLRWALASRDGMGVNAYPLRLEGLSRVLRPTQKWDEEAARAWFQTVRGQKYDWLGILVFTLAVEEGAHDRMFCSEFATRLDRAAGFEPFARDMDADRVAPASFLYSAMFETIWTDEDRETKRPRDHRPRDHETMRLRDKGLRDHRLRDHETMRLRDKGLRDHRLRNGTAEKRNGNEQKKTKQTKGRATFNFQLSTVT